MLSSVIAKELFQALGLAGFSDENAISLIMQLEDVARMPIILEGKAKVSLVVSTTECELPHEETRNFNNCGLEKLKAVPEPTLEERGFTKEGDEPTKDGDREEVCDERSVEYLGDFGRRN